MADFGISEIAAAASLAGTAATAVGAITSGNAAAAQSNYSAQVAANNAVIARQNAAYASEAGAVKATDQAMRQRGIAGATRAALAASGIDVNTGSPADVLQSQAEIGQLDTERVRDDAALKAYGYRTQATGYLAEAGLERQAASNDTTAGFLKAGGTVLSGASQFAPGGKWASLFTSANAPYSAAGTAEY